MKGFPKFLTLALVLLIFQISCDNSNDTIAPDEEIQINFASVLSDTVWNQLTIDYSIESDKIGLAVNLLVDNSLINSFGNGDELILNTKDFSDGIHEIELQVVADDEIVGSSKHEAHFLNTLAVGEFGDYLVNGRKGYVLIDHQGTTIDFAEIINNSTLTIPRPDDFEEKYFNVTLISILNGEWEQFLFYTTKNVSYWEYEPEETFSSNFNSAEFDFINLPSEYNYFNVGSGGYNMFGKPDNLIGPLEDQYSFNYSSAYKDFYMYVSEDEGDRYFYIVNLDDISIGSTFDFNQSSAAMDAFTLTFNYPVSDLFIRMDDGTGSTLNVYGYSTGYSKDDIPATNFQFSLPRLENFEAYNEFEVRQSLIFNGKTLNIQSKHSEITNAVELASTVDFDYTYSNPGLGQMDLDIQGKYDYVEYRVDLQRPSDLSNMTWFVEYMDYTDEHSFPQIPGEIIADFNALLNGFDFKGTDIKIGKTTKDGIICELVD